MRGVAVSVSLGEEMHCNTNGSPKRSYQYEGEKQPLRQSQIGRGIAWIPCFVGGMIRLIKLPKSGERPHKLATIQ
jgi:hypothetical protein